LFFDGHFASFVWNIVHITFEIQPPTSFSNLFVSWPNGLCLKLRNQIMFGAAPLFIELYGWIEMIWYLAMLNSNTYL